MENEDKHWSNLRTWGAFHHFASEKKKKNRPLIFDSFKRNEETIQSLTLHALMVTDGTDAVSANQTAGLAC